VVVGLPYTAQYQSVKLGEMTNEGSPLNMQKKVGKLGLVMADVHPKGLQFGPSFDVLDDMPGMENAAPVPSTAWSAYDENPIEFPAQYDTDVRICLQAQAPRPVTVLGVTPDLEALR
jgi:hypothetical protein